MKASIIMPRKLASRYQIYAASTVFWEILGSAKYEHVPITHNIICCSIFYHTQWAQKTRTEPLPWPYFVIFGSKASLRGKAAVIWRSTSGGWQKRDRVLPPVPETWFSCDIIRAQLAPLVRQLRVCVEHTLRVQRPRRQWGERLPVAANN